MNRFADGTDMVIHGYIFIECDAKNFYMVSKGSWEPATLIMARLKQLWARWQVLSKIASDLSKLGPYHLHRTKRARSQYSEWGYRDRALILLTALSMFYFTICNRFCICTADLFRCTQKWSRISNGHLSDSEGRRFEYYHFCNTEYSMSPFTLNLGLGFCSLDYV